MNNAAVMAQNMFIVSLSLTLLLLDCVFSMAIVQLLGINGDELCVWDDLRPNTTFAQLKWRIDRLFPSAEVKVLREEKVLQPSDLVLTEGKEITILNLVKVKKRSLKVETFITTDGERALYHKELDIDVEVMRNRVTVKAWLERLNEILPITPFNDQLKVMINEDLQVREILRRDLLQSKDWKDDTVPVILWLTSNDTFKFRLDTQYYLNIREPAPWEKQNQIDYVLETILEPEVPAGFIA